MNNKEVLIIGAGSTGLSSGLFLSMAGFKPRITEKRAVPSTITKALGVNPRTLELFEGTEVTRRFLQNGRKVSCFNLWCKDKLVYKNDLSKVKHKYPFMLVQPQYETERIIEEALAERGIQVERGMELDSLIPRNGLTEISFKGAGNNSFGGVVIGADGHKSRVRESIQAGFTGWEHHEVFTMYDIELDTPINSNDGHYFFYKEGGMLMLHIKDGIWRVGGNIKDVLGHLPRGTTTGRITWETTFTIREMIATKFNVGNVFLLGDAAHIHSPAGARGMNLCIEDSYIFAKLLRENRHYEYHSIRRPAIKKVVGILGVLTDKIGGRNLVGDTVRSNLDKLSVFFPLVMPRFKKFILGI